MNDKPFSEHWSDDVDARRNQQEHAEFENQLQDVQSRQRKGAARIDEMDRAMHARSDRLTEVLIEEMRGIGRRVDQVAVQLDVHMTKEHAEFKEVHEAWTQARGMGRLALWLFAGFSSLLAALAWVYEHYEKLTRSP